MIDRLPFDRNRSSRLFPHWVGVDFSISWELGFGIWELGDWGTGGRLRSKPLSTIHYPTPAISANFWLICSKAMPRWLILRLVSTDISAKASCLEGT
jgi:hypothetical protein